VSPHAAYHNIVLASCQRLLADTASLPSTRVQLSAHCLADTNTACRPWTSAHASLHRLFQAQHFTTGCSYVTVSLAPCMHSATCASAWMRACAVPTSSTSLLGSSGLQTQPPTPTQSSASQHIQQQLSARKHIHTEPPRTLCNLHTAHAMQCTRQAKQDVFRAAQKQV
jgi:hypothetical protein